MSASALSPHRPRPVADTPLLDGRELAKAWLVELVAAAPLERAAVARRPAFPDDAPRLCAAIVAALGTDAALADLEPDGAQAGLAARAAALAGAAAPVDVVAALEALRTVTWHALVAALDQPQPALVADLADRLSAVIAVLAAAALDAPGPRERGPLAAVLRGERDVDAPVPGEAHTGTEPQDAPAPPEPVSAAPPVAAPVREAPQEGTATALLAPRHDPFAQPVVPDLGADEAVRGPSVVDLGQEQRVGPVVEDATGFRAARVAPWTAAIERRLARHRGDGSPFAVLCLEVAGLDRLVAADAAGAALEAAEAAVCAHLRPADALVRERPGRLWLTAPDTDVASARALAHRIAAAVAEVPARHAPLQAAVGVAVCPWDGADALQLEGGAEEGLFAARAAGVRVAGSGD